MYLRFERMQRRLCVNLVIARRVDGKVVQSRVGPLGSVIFSEPISTAERIRFWTQFDARWRELAARRPDVVFLADLEKTKIAIDRRIPLPRTPDEHKLFFQAIVVRDAMAAFDRLERGEDAAAEAAKQLERLTHEGRENRSEQNGASVMLAPTNEERRP
jgi:hypothetical protein